MNVVILHNSGKNTGENTIGVMSDWAITGRLTKIEAAGADIFNVPGVGLLRINLAQYLREDGRDRLVNGDFESLCRRF